MTGVARRLLCLVSPLQRTPCPPFSSGRTWLCFCFHFSGWKLNQAWHCRRCWKIQQCANPQPTDASGHHRFAVITLYYVRLTARRHQSSWTNGELDWRKIRPLPADSLPSTHTNQLVLSLPGWYQLSITGDVSDVSIPFADWLIYIPAPPIGPLSKTE